MNFVFSDSFQGGGMGSLSGVKVEGTCTGWEHLLGSVSLTLTDTSPRERACLAPGWKGPVNQGSSCPGSGQNCLCGQDLPQLKPSSFLLCIYSHMQLCTQISKVIAFLLSIGIQNISKEFVIILKKKNPV